MRFFLVLYWNEDEGYDIDTIDEFVGFHTKEAAKEFIEKYATETTDFLPARWMGDTYHSINPKFEQRLEIRPLDIRGPV